MAMVDRREFLLGGLAAGGLGVAALQIPRSIEQRSVSPLHHGAVGDGIADDIEAVREALSHAVRSGVPVDGGDRVFAVGGDISIVEAASPWIRSLRLKQLIPQMDGKTLNFKGCESILVERLTIDRGSNKTLGLMDSAGGLWIEGGSNHRVSNVEISGHGKANGIVLWGTQKSIYDHLLVRDMGFDDAAAADDVLQGIWMVRNADCVLRNPRVSNLFGNARYAGAEFPNLRTRGIALGGNVRVEIIEPHIRHVDQGIDFTGSDGNRQCMVRGGYSYECASVGVKLANTAVGCRVIGHTVERAGMYGFLASGPSEKDLRYKTQECDFVDCTALDIGFNGISHPTPAGFEILKGDYDIDHPKGIRFIRCRAIDRQPRKTMKYGFFSNVANDAASSPNRLVDCSSQGHIIEGQSGAWR